MASALQPQLRVQVSDWKFHNLLEYFFPACDFSGTRILELGPGQCDFSRLAAERGARIAVMDHDPAVLELARKRGYDTINCDFLSFDWSSLRAQFDGLFARHSIAAQRFGDPLPLVAMVNEICAVPKPEGWGWITPWNRFRTTEPQHAESLMTAQRQAFGQNGFAAFEVTGLVAGRDLIWDHWELFLKGIDLGPEQASRERLYYYTVP